MPIRQSPLLNGSGSLPIRKEIVGVGLAVAVGVLVGVAVFVDVGVGVAVLVGVLVGVAVWVAVLVGVAVFVGVKATHTPFWQRAPVQSRSEQQPSIGMQVRLPLSSAQQRSPLRLQQPSPQTPSSEQQYCPSSMHAPSQHPSTEQIGWPLGQQSSSP